MTVYLNVRSDITRETKDRMVQLCKEKKVTFGVLLNETFAK